MRALVNCPFCNSSNKMPEDWSEVWNEHLKGHPDPYLLITKINYTNDSSINNYNLYKKQCEIIDIINEKLGKKLGI